VLNELLGFGKPYFVGPRPTPPGLGGKCEFWIDQVPFLGHIISNGGISVDPPKVKEIVEWRIPSTVTEVWSFLGLAGY
jgi:hypothetical protein